jgi:hypothetical protein
MVCLCNPIQFEYRQLLILPDGTLGRFLWVEEDDPDYLVIAVDNQGHIDWFDYHELTIADEFISADEV